MNREVLRAVKGWDQFVFGGGGRHGDARPDQKIIFLSGDQGTGKTSLAHVIANRCGFLQHLFTNYGLSQVGMLCRIQGGGGECKR